MIRFFQKWWALREFNKESNRLGFLKLSAQHIALGIRFHIAEEAIVGQIVRDSLKRFSWIIRDNNKREKELSNKYSSIFQEAKKEGLIDQIPDNKVIENGVVLNPPGRAWISPTHLGDKFISEFWFKILFDNAIAKTIIITGLTILTTFIVKNMVLGDISRPPVVNVYPNIQNNFTQPEIKPLINIYPNK